MITKAGILVIAVRLIDSAYENENEFKRLPYFPLVNVSCVSSQSTAFLVSLPDDERLC